MPPTKYAAADNKVIMTFRSLALQYAKLGYTKMRKFSIHFLSTKRVHKDAALRGYTISKALKEKSEPIVKIL